MSEQDILARLAAYQSGIAAALWDTAHNHHGNPHKLASDKYPQDHILFEVWLQGWNSCKDAMQFGRV